ncbi:MAG: HlyD family efflux transporter periplasmic adaptor subunit [Lautropia sp.]|nr:HlyD family efflux transporter periplasmic adaptor subunit [Lautropia sp.]
MNVSGGELGRLLPPLREDLKLHEAAVNRDGSPAWVIHDPVTNRFFRIGWLEFEMLSHWPLRDPTLLLQAIEQQGPLAASAAELGVFIAFLRQHQLLRVSTPQGTRELEKIRLAAAGSRWQWLLHNYLFFRVPLVRPQRFLQWLLPRVGFLFTAGFACFTVFCTLIGVLLAIRQWDSFVHTFQDFLGPQGLLGFALALTLAKALHELGHALTATRYGVRVAHMGVAFLVLWPMLYTDTAESWKLADRRQRFAIAAAGIITELGLAGFATLAWSLADDGALRSALFFLATTSWLITLAINVSPFMRFDGYFLLSDALDLPNLHQRSFALARAALRRGLLGWNEPDPEPFSPALRRGLVAFAWATWLYRLVVFIGIALAVYHFFFKALGVFLLAVELVWFIARPVWSEVRTWASGRRRMQAGHAMRSLLVLLGLFALLAVPWQTSIRADGWLHAERQQLVYSPVPARVLTVSPAGRVRQGQVLAILDSPDARSKAAQSLIAAQALALQLDQTVGRVEGLERRATIAEQLAQQRAEVLAQRAEVQRLTLSAGFAGVLSDLDAHVGPGVWVNATQPIAILYDPADWVVDALVPQEAIGRFAVGAPAQFHRRGRWAAPVAGEVIAVDTARAQSLPHPMLAAVHGGRLAATGQPDGSLAPRDAVYRVRIRLAAAPGSVMHDERQPERQELGSVSIEVERRSLLARWATGAAALLLRESGF